VGQLVGLALSKGCRLADLKIEEFRSANASIDESVYKILGVEQSVAAFRSYGSTGPDEVRKQISRWKHKLGVRGSKARIKESDGGSQESGSQK
jgi:argininosuccinate lyase